MRTVTTYHLSTLGKVRGIDAKFEIDSARQNYSLILECPYGFSDDKAEIPFADSFELRTFANELLEIANKRDGDS